MAALMRCPIECIGWMCIFPSGFSILTVCLVQTLDVRPPVPCVLRQNLPPERAPLGAGGYMYPFFWPIAFCISSKIFLCLLKILWWVQCSHQFLICMFVISRFNCMWLIVRSGEWFLTFGACMELCGEYSHADTSLECADNVLPRRQVQLHARVCVKIVYISHP